MKTEAGDGKPLLIIRRRRLTGDPRALVGALARVPRPWHRDPRPPLVMRGHARPETDRDNA